MNPYYSNRIAFCDENITRYNRLINYCSFGRLFSIVIGFILIYQALAAESIMLTFAAFFATVLVFVWLVRQHSFLYARRQDFQNLRTVNQNEIDNFQSGSNFYSDGQQWSDEKHPYSADLDIFGGGALYQRINRAATSGCNRKLVGWLDAAADIHTINARQAASNWQSSKNNIPPMFVTFTSIYR